MFQSRIKKVIEVDILKNLGARTDYSYTQINVRVICYGNNTVHLIYIEYINQKQHINHLHALHT